MDELPHIPLGRCHRCGQPAVDMGPGLVSTCADCTADFLADVEHEDTADE